MNPLLKQLGISLPIIQAPMAGVSTPAMAAAVANAGALGSVGVGNIDAPAARDVIASIRRLTDRPFNVNLFCHQPASADPAKEAAWIKTLSPHFAKFNAQPPTHLREIYTSFIVDDAMFAMLLQERPPTVSFHFGLPRAEWIRALHDAGIMLLATATNLPEAHAIHQAGIDAIVAQGYEAGGHRGIFNPDAPDDCLSTLPLTRLLGKNIPLPIIAAGGIMDGAGIATALALGASAAQLGTAFIPCPESSANPGYRNALLGPQSHHTTITRAISGRPARCLTNHFTTLGQQIDPATIPAYPIAYDAAKSLNAAALAANESGYGPQWAGQGAPLGRALPATELIALLRHELEAAIAAKI